MKQNYVFIYAYIAGNMGDDLMVRCLCERYPKIKFVLCADGKYKEGFGDIKNLTFYDQCGEKAKCWNRFWKKVKGTEDGFRKMLIKMAKMVVHIGGSVFVQHFDDYSLLLQSDQQLRRLSRRIYVVGANFGPYTDINYYKQYHELLRHYDGVVFRDKYSKELFEDLENVRYAPDVVFNYYSESQMKEKKQVLMSVISMEERNNKFAISGYAQDYYLFIEKLSKAYIHEGYEIVYISFCQMQKDEEAIKKIRAQLSEGEKQHTKVCCYQGDNLQECMGMFDESEVVVGTRFHSIIIGELKEKKIIPIIYDQKTRHVLDDQGELEYVLLEQLKDADVEQVMRGAKRLSKETKNKLITDADGQFAYLDEILNRKSRCN